MDHEASRQPDTPDSLDAVRHRLALALPAQAAFDGWGATAVDAAAADTGIDTDIARLALGSRPIDLVDAWISAIDRVLEARFSGNALTDMKVRERITRLIEARLELAAPVREGTRRAVAVMAQPQNLARSVGIAWRSADVMWRLAGDRSTDFNHYTKRTLLAGVYAATLLVFLDDKSDGHTATRAFLTRRIDGVMRFETAKRGFSTRHADRPSLARFVGRLRYPAR